MAEVTRKTSIGHSNRVEIFALTGANFSETATHTFDRITGISVTGAIKKKNIEIDIDNAEDSENLATLFATYLTSEEVEEIVDQYVNGDKTTIQQAGEGAASFGVLEYSGVNHSNKRRVKGLLAVFGPNTGDETIEAKQSKKIKIQIQAIDATQTYTIPAACYNTTLVTGATTQTIASSAVGTEAFFTEAT
jgi:endonuclease YncB( thermonuclease family)